MMSVRVKLFAMARDIAGVHETIISLPTDSTTSGLLQSLLLQYPRLKDWRNHFRIAVNCEYVDLHQPLHDGDEVAIIPPVSGG